MSDKIARVPLATLQWMRLSMKTAEQQRMRQALLLAPGFAPFATLRSGDLVRIVSDLRSDDFVVLRLDSSHCDASGNCIGGVFSWWSREIEPSWN